MFAGIGGFRAGLTRAGGFTCIGHCEIDKYANQSYEAAHFPKESEVYYPDATKIDETAMPDFDLLCGGFPCQSFSIAGKRKGFEDVYVHCFLDGRDTPPVSAEGYLAELENKMKELQE